MRTTVNTFDQRVRRIFLETTKMVSGDIMTSHSTSRWSLSMNAVKRVSSYSEDKKEGTRQGREVSWKVTVIVCTNSKETKGQRFCGDTWDFWVVVNIASWDCPVKNHVDISLTGSIPQATWSIPILMIDSVLPISNLLYRHVPDSIAWQERRHMHESRACPQGRQLWEIRYFPRATSGYEQFRNFVPQSLSTQTDLSLQCRK